RGLRAFVLVGVLLVVVVLAGAVLWLLKPGRQGDPAVPDASAGTGEWRELAEVLPSPGRPGDGMDPIRAECGSPAVVATVITLDEVSVRLPGGAEFGRLRLRHQPSCRASWGQVLGPHGQDRVVHIVLRRPADRVSAPSSFGGQSPTSHGNLLLTTSGCVYAEAFVRTPEGDGPVVRTRCA
ncbi:YjfA family protein, partial [Nonomuraea sp. MG754425]|uniref:YjfA family protein n=1 Tax=Nonomuraea sp. MG754425 TaxID=2570319 RepID=UPI001F376D98